MTDARSCDLCGLPVTVLGHDCLRELSGAVHALTARVAELEREALEQKSLREVIETLRASLHRQVGQ